MKTWHKLFAASIASVVVAGFGYIIWIEEMTATLAVGVLTTFGVVGAAILTHVLTKQREIDARHFEQKRAIYDELLGWYTQLLRQNNPRIGNPRDKRLSERELATRLFDLQRKAVLWSDNDILKWWLQMMESANESHSKSSIEPVMKMDKLIRLMREELGKNNAGIKPGDLMAMFLLGGRDELRAAKRNTSE